MEAIKQRLYSLEENYKVLTDMIHKSASLENEIHYVTSSMEQGIMPLEDFDTFRYVHVKDWLFTEFIQNGGIWRRGISHNADIYFLMNPTDEVKQLVEQIAGYKINFTKHTICFKYSGIKKDFEMDFTNKMISSLYLFWYQGGPCYGKLSLTREIRMAINSKIFEVEEFISDLPVKSRTCDMSLYKFMNEKNFTASLTVDFKVPFILPPHVSFFITPLDLKSIEARVKKITETQVVFEFSYGRDLIPMTTNFHWLVQGSK